MKKMGIYLLSLCSILLAGCGSADAKNSNVNEVETYKVSEKSDNAEPVKLFNTVESTESTEASDQGLWDQKVQVDGCELFQKSDLIQYDNYSATWENDQAQANLTYIDTKVYLTYKSELGECVDAEFDYIQANTITGTKFYEEDVDSDGKKELLISYTQGTGTGANMSALCIYDLDHKELIPFFEKNDFSEQQKQDILKRITDWNSEGFQEKSGLGIENLSDIKSGYFVPTLVKVNGTCMVQVKYLLRDPERYYDDNACKAVYALLAFHGEQLKVNDLWCKIK